MGHFDSQALECPSDRAEDAIIDSWARFAEIEVPIRRKSGLDERAVVDELRLVRQVAASVFADPSVARDAAHFVLGYSAAYNDWASGRFG